MELPPSMVARSPAYWRTMMGWDAVPFSLLANVPLYVPPRSQIVSPGRTEAGWSSAVWRRQGLLKVPVPLALALGET